MAQGVKNPPAKQETQETWVRFLGREDPQEEEINGNPLQHPCLEYPMERGALWATVHEIAESDTTDGQAQPSLDYNPLPPFRVEVDIEDCGFSV